MTYRIQTLNEISPKGLARLPDLAHGHPPAELGVDLEDPYRR